MENKNFKEQSLMRKLYGFSIIIKKREPAKTAGRARMNDKLRRTTDVKSSAYEISTQRALCENYKRGNCAGRKSALNTENL